MHGIGVRGGMHGRRVDAEFLAGPQDAKGDLAAIGYQDLVKHGVPTRKQQIGTRRSLLAIRYSIITSGSPNSTGWPSSTRICVTVPARGDGIWFMVFIASMMSSVCPAETLAPTSMKGFAPGSGDQ